MKDWIDRMKRGAIWAMMPQATQACRDTLNLESRVARKDQYWARGKDRYRTVRESSGFGLWAIPRSKKSWGASNPWGIYRRARGLWCTRKCKIWITNSIWGWIRWKLWRKWGKLLRVGRIGVHNDCSSKNRRLKNQPRSRRNTSIRNKILGEWPQSRRSVQKMKLE